MDGIDRLDRRCEALDDVQTAAFGDIGDRLDEPIGEVRHRLIVTSGGRDVAPLPLTNECKTVD
jgi:hypothetical protein